MFEVCTHFALQRGNPKILEFVLFYIGRQIFYFFYRNLEENFGVGENFNNTAK